MVKLSVPLFQADQEFVGPFGGNSFQIQPLVKPTSVMTHNSKTQYLQENSQMTTQNTQLYKGFTNAISRCNVSLCC